MKKFFGFSILFFFLQSIVYAQHYNTAWISAYYTPTKAFDVKVNDQFAYVVGWEDDFYGYYGSLLIIDISNPYTPYFVGSTWTMDAYGIDVRDDYAFIAEGNSGLRIYNISNPSQPFLIGQRILPSSAKDVKVVGNLAYVADEYAGMRIIDISKLQDPFEVGFFDSPGRAFDVEIKDTLAYLADVKGGLFCIDIKNSSNPFIVSNYPATDAIIDIDLKDTLAFCTDGYSGIKVLDIADPNNLRLVDSLYIPYWCLGIKVSGNYAYVVSWDGGLRIVDISDPKNIQEVGYYDTNGYSRDIDVVGALVFVADWDGGGLQIINNDLLNPLSINNNSETLPKVYELKQNYPNPFNPVTTIDYEIPIISSISIKVYNLLGQEIETLIDEDRSPGYYSINFNASHLSSGVYFYTLQAGDYIRSRKMLLLK